MRKKCKRKVWKLVNPITHAIEGCAILTDKDLTELRIRELNAIDSMVNGTGSIDDWSSLNGMNNLAETMSRAGIGVEVLEVCYKAQEELVRSAKRFEAIGRMGLTGEGIQIMRELFEYHDIQRRSVTRSDYERFIQKSINIVRGKGKNVQEI